jgi:hypothetical protein
MQAAETYCRIKGASETGPTHPVMQQAIEAKSLTAQAGGIVLSSDRLFEPGNMILFTNPQGTTKSADPGCGRCRKLARQNWDGADPVSGSAVYRPEVAFGSVD